MPESHPIRLLVVDDEKNQRELLEGFLQKKRYAVHSAGGGEEALAWLLENGCEVILTDHKMPGMDGITLLKAVKALNPEIVVVLMTAYGTVEKAVEAMKLGAYDYLTKPIDLDELLILLGRIEERLLLTREVRQLRQELKEKFSFEGVITQSPRMEEVLSMVARVAPSQSTILIRGESGTGKGLLARVIHFQSQRSRGPFLTLNCAAIPENLLESELFGHEKGAFTGAFALHQGKFEQAHGGTLFLDEIGDLSPALQAKLLRAVQDRAFERVGGSKTIEVDVRLISATHQNLEQRIREQRFREDLYYRLNVVSLFLPPLRERKEDIPILLDHFLKKFGKANRKERLEVSSEARDLLLRYDYPGNIRELENLVERAVVLCRGQMITTQELPFHLKEGVRETGGAPPAADLSLTDQLDALEKTLIQQALEAAAGVQTRAAEKLGISERVLRYKLKKYQL
ncbi:MAG: sigma-54-dependent Fis family transcriptional regulator [Deltaproteobacteria bacterium]|nr:sigma-54-dependent Fis family transcriptional regulator [Deltaproteobacteria bacterium]